MNALIFFAAFFAALAVLVWIVDAIQDGFHKIKQARSVARVLPRSPRDIGGALENVSGAESGADAVPGSHLNRRSSGPSPTLPGVGAAPDAPHWLVEVWPERRHYAAVCTCGAVMHGLTDLDDAKAWCVLHGMFAEELGA